MAKDAMRDLKIQKDLADGILQASRRDDALKLLNQWKMENFGTTDVRVTPPKEALPPWAWPYIPKADALPQDGMKVANFMVPSGSGRTISEDAYWKGYDTIMETTIDGSDAQIKRLDTLFHQFNDQVSNPSAGLKIAQNKTPSQKNATNMRDMIKKLTKEGKHTEAQALYREQFPRA